MRSAHLRESLEEIDRQRAALFMRLDGISTEELWRRPDNGRWSLGQNLEHLCKAIRLFRWMFRAHILCGRPWARLFRQRPFGTEVANRYAVGAKPIKAPPGVRPPDRTGSTVPFHELRQRLDTEREKLESLLAGIDQDVAGHIKMWDLKKSVINLLQAVRLVAYHEGHHLRFAHELLDQRQQAAAAAPLV
jgi:hypothetical protein